MSAEPVEIAARPSTSNGRKIGERKVSVMAEGELDSRNSGSGLQLAMETEHIDLPFIAGGMSGSRSIIPIR